MERNPIIILTVGGKDYYIHPTASHRLSPRTPSKSSAKDFVPCTVVNWDQDQFTQVDLTTISASFTSEDDVWNPGFLAGSVGLELLVYHRRVLTCVP